MVEVSILEVDMLCIENKMQPPAAVTRELEHHYSCLKYLVGIGGIKM